MQQFELESVEGVGYLLFERYQSVRNRRIGNIFLDIQQAKQYLEKISQKDIELVYSRADEEMVTGEEAHLDHVTKV